MATNNITFPIYNADGTPFHDLVMRKATYDSVVMSLGDKITGDVFYKDNTLHFTMREYVVYNGVKHTMINPPTVVREGMVGDNGELKGMTKYSLEFYHPMCQLSNLPFSDVAVSPSEQRYLSENKTFSWCGKPNDFIEKLNNNLEGTQWIVEKSSNFPESVNDTISDVLSFDKATIADALKTMYDTWKLPYIIDVVKPTEPAYAQNKFFKVIVGMPCEEIYPSAAAGVSPSPYIFRFGKGVGLKNNSRSPRNNKIVTRISGYGSERNIPYGYPQVIWYGNQTWKYTINNDSTNPLSYPIYDGIVGGKWVKLIKHPFTRAHLMPKVYVEKLFNKVSPYAVKELPPIPPYSKVLEDLYASIDNKLANYTQAGPVNNGFIDLKETIQAVVANGVAGTYEFGDAGSLQYEGKVVLSDDGMLSGEMYADDNYYPKFDGYTFSKVWVNDNSATYQNPNYNPQIELVDYYDAIGEDYPNNINTLAPSYDTHEFEEVYPKLGDVTVVGVQPITTDYIQFSEIGGVFDKYISMSSNDDEKAVITSMKTEILGGSQYNRGSGTVGEYEYSFSYTSDEEFLYIEYKSNLLNFKIKSLNDGVVPPEVKRDDTMDEDGNYKQSYFKITLPILSFDLYASASITEKMDIYMRSGACIGCTFPVQVDWDDYKQNFFSADGKFLPDGPQRDIVKYPKSNEKSITIAVQKDKDTFGTLMPNAYQKPQAGDKFVILGISLPLSYITTAEEELENAAKAYMLENNIYYFDYPLKLDEFFLTNNKPILDQIKPNSIMRFDFAGEEKILYVKQITSKYGFTPLPQYNITLTDNIEVSLNQIGQTVDDLDKLTSIVNSLRDQNNQNLLPAIAKCLSKVDDDTAQGFIRFIKGLQVGDSFVSGILGSGGVFRMDADGTSYIEVDKMYVRMKAYFDNVEVREYKHLSGNRVVTQAGAKSCRVEWVDSQGNYLEQLEQNLNNVVKFRCFFRATDGEDSIKNGFLLGDLVYCHVTSVRGGIDNPEQKGLNTKHYWRLCVGRNEEGTLTSDGEAWIDLSNRTEEYIEQEDEHGETVLVAYRGFQSGSDVPEAQDSMIQLGNVNDQDRQGAIIEFVTGSNSPTYQIYQGIGSDRTNIYSLNNKNQISFGYNSQTGHAYMNVFGDMYFGDPNGSTYIKYEQENPQTHRPLLKIKAVVEFQSPDSQWTTLEEFAAAVMGDIENLQDQVDGQIETWFYDYDPTLQNAPASDWDTDDEKNNHLGDLFYNTEKGYAWRWGRTEEEGSYVYQWFRIEDTDVVRALADAARAQDTADHKRRVFTATPYSPYDAGDLWVNATYPAGYTGETDEAQHKYNNEILKCISPIPRTENGHEVNTSSINDWSLADGSTSKLKKFITDTYNPFVQNIKDQVDKKAETWYQDADPSTAWTTATLKNEHVGDIWCNTADGEGHKTYVYTANENPTTHAISYSWEEMAVPDEVFDQIDGKASIFVQKPTEYGSNDLWIIEASNITCPENDIPNGCKRGDIVIADNVTSEDGKRTEYNKADWHKKDRYTDDTALNAFINGDYATFARNIQSQVDRKAETWYQTTDPSLAWTTAALQQAHVGDIWHNSSQITINNVEAGQDAIWNGSSWVVSTVPSEVYDQIDGKSSIYVQKPTTYEAKDLWIIGSDVSSYDMPSGCQMGDIVISSTSRTNNYNKNDWGKKDRYTDDTKFDGFINQILNTSGGGSSEGDVAHALGVIKAALNQGTTINGGLVLSTLIGLRDGDNVLWSGISGQYMSQETGAGYKGHGIASWYGGGMRDWEVYKENGGTGTLDSTFAKSLFRFDGSGYLASGNISWDKNGTVRIANVYGDTLNDLANLASNLPITLRDGEPYFNPLLGFTQLNVLGSPVLTQDSAENNFVSKAYLNSMFTKTQSGNTEYILPQLSFYSINVQGSPVATESWVNSNYVSIQFFENLFNAFDSSGNVVHPNSNSAIDNIKAMVGLWTNQYLSALGLNSSGSGGGGGEGVSWTDLAGSTTEQINLSHLRAVTNNYATKQTAVTGMVIDGNNYRLYRGDNSSFTVPVGGVLKIRIGTSTVDYTPSSGTVILPAYPDVQIPTDYWHTGDTRAVHTVLAAPVDGDGVASFRTLQHTDLPGLPANKIISGTFDVDRIPQLPASKISGLDLDFLPSSGGTVTGNINVTNDVTIGGILVLKYSSSVSQRLYCDSSGNLYDGYGQLAHMSDIGGGSSADIATKTWVNSQGFATQSWVTRQGYLTSSNTYVDTTNNTVTINGTTISVSGGGGGGGGAYLPLTGGTLTGFLNVEYDNFRVRVLNDRIRFAALSGGQESISTELTIETSLISSYSGRLKVGNNVLAYVSELPNLASYATQTWVQQQNYVTASALASALTSYAYITPATGTITIGSNSINVNSGLGNYLPLTGGTLSGNLKVGTGSQYTTIQQDKIHFGITSGGSEVMGLNLQMYSNTADTANAGKRLNVGEELIAYLSDIPTVSYPVTSVVGQTGAITAAQIGTALTTAGYKLTDTTYSFSNADATLVWSTRTKIATVGGTDIYVTMPANPDTNSNTWRGIYTGGTSQVGNAITSKAMNFVGGSNISVSYEAAGTGSGQSGNADYFNIKIAATGLVTSVKVGNTSYSPSNGVVSLPAYPTDYWKTGDTRTQNTFLAAPNGSNGAASFRRIEIEDIPDISESYLSTSGGTVDGDITVGSTSSIKNIRVYGVLQSYYNLSYYSSLSCTNGSSGVYFNTPNTTSSIVVRPDSPYTQMEFSMSGLASFRYYFSHNVYINGSCDATSHPTHSDARMKDIVDNMALVDVNTIAMAPAVRFRWKEGLGLDNDLHCGTLAQYWNTVMPECTKASEDSGYLSMQYDVIALLAAISVAKKVVDHEQRITELERENERLRTELEQLRLNMEA